MNVHSKQIIIPNVKLKPTVNTGPRLVYIRLPKPIIVVIADKAIALPEKASMPP